MDSDKTIYWDTTYTMNSNYTIEMSPELIAAIDAVDNIKDAMWYGAWSGTAYVDENQKKALGLISHKRDIDKFDYLLEEAK
jgi:hypothetical protein